MTLRLRAVAKYEARSKDGQIREIFRTKIVDEMVPCKICKKNPRMNGSSGCLECKQKDQMRRVSDAQLARRIQSANPPVKENKKWQ